MSGDDGSSEAPPDGDVDAATTDDASGWSPDLATVGTGGIGGVAIPIVQFALWQLVAAGPLTGPGGGQIAAEMALFVVVGVVVPAGGIAVLYEDAPLAGVLGALAYPLGTFGLARLVVVPDWFVQGIAWTAGVLAVVLVLEWTASSPEAAGTAGQ